MRDLYLSPCGAYSSREYSWCSRIYRSQLISLSFQRRLRIRESEALVIISAKYGYEIPEARVIISAKYEYEYEMLKALELVEERFGEIRLESGEIRSFLRGIKRRDSGYKAERFGEVPGRFGKMQRMDQVDDLSAAGIIHLITELGWDGTITNTAINLMSVFLLRGKNIFPKLKFLCFSPVRGVFSHFPPLAYSRRTKPMEGGGTIRFYLNTVKTP